MGRRVTLVTRSRRSVTVALFVSLTILAGCNLNKGKSSEPVLAEAFAGPIALNLRQEISPASRTAVTVRHGERLEVLQVRRRFVRVRNAQGQEGWTDSRNLLTAEQMTAIGELGKTAAQMPAQGQATVFSTLNVHTDPSRQSTSFFQITESMRVDVVAHRLTPRSGGEETARFARARIQQEHAAVRLARAGEQITRHATNVGPARRDF